MVKFRMNHGNYKRGEPGRRSSNMRYIVILIALLVLFIWLLTVNMEPLMEMLLGVPEHSQVICSVESGELQMIDDLILAPAADGSGLIWIAHNSSAISNYGHRPPYEIGHPFKMPPGLTEFWTEDDKIYEFSRMTKAGFRVFEEAYNQLYSWHLEFGEYNVVSGLLSCTDSVATYPAGEMIFVALLDISIEPPLSICLLWPNDMDERPLTEMIFSLSKLNQISGLNIFSDLLERKNLKQPQELGSILSLGYHTEYYNTRLSLQSLVLDE